MVSCWDGRRRSPDRGCPATTGLKLPRWDELASIPLTLGTGVRPSQGGHEEYPSAAADGGAIGFWDFIARRCPAAAELVVRRHLGSRVTQEGDAMATATESLRKMREICLAQADTREGDHFGKI